MSLFIKICGITSEGTAEAAVAAGADALGFVFAQSPRQLSPTRASEISRDIPQNIEKVAVFLSPKPGDVDRVLEQFDADTVQADQHSLVGFNSLPIFPVVRDSSEVVPNGHRILFEGVRSGSGRQANWSIAAELAHHHNLVLAGGLHVGNVRRAIDLVRPFGVDVSSGLELSRGIKDVGLINGFINEVRNIEKGAVTA